jgi:hypothetical protein
MTTRVPCRHPSCMAWSPRGRGYIGISFRDISGCLSKYLADILRQSSTQVGSEASPCFISERKSERANFVLPSIPFVNPSNKLFVHLQAQSLNTQTLDQECPLLSLCCTALLAAARRLTKNATRMVNLQEGIVSYEYSTTLPDRKSETSMRRLCP